MDKASRSPMIGLAGLLLVSSIASELLVLLVVMVASAGCACGDGWVCTTGSGWHGLSGHRKNVAVSVLGNDWIFHLGNMMT